MTVKGTASIFRLTNLTGITEDSVRLANDSIEFDGTDLKPDQNSFIESFEGNFIEDVSIHPNPNRHLSQIQDGKLGTIEIIIKGIFKSPSSAIGPIIFTKWMKQDKDNDYYPFGRFGLRYGNLPIFNITPTLTKGLILYDFKIKDVEEFQDKAVWEARFYVNGVP